MQLSKTNRKTCSSSSTLRGADIARYDPESIPYIEQDIDGSFCFLATGTSLQRLGAESKVRLEPRDRKDGRHR